MSDIGETVTLVSFLSANPGITLRDAAAATQRTPGELVKELEKLLMCGVPPYSPGDYINYRLDGRGDEARVHVQFARHFARPLNFTPQEALALKYALEHFARGADEDSARQIEQMLETLRQALHGRAFEAIADKGKGFVTPRRTLRMRELIATLRQAAEDRRVTEIEYYSSHRARLARRKVHPFAVLEIGPHFYLYAYCTLARDTRHFRLDRIRNANVLDEEFADSEPRKRRLGRMQSLFEGRPKDTMRVRFSKQAAREVYDEWEGSPDVKLETLPDGQLIIETPLYNPFWAAGFIMGFGKHAKLLEPKWLRRDLTETLQKSLDAHGG